MKRASFAALAVLVFLLAHVDASITGAVEGVIKDSVTGQVLEGVKITIVSAKSQMITSELLTDSSRCRLDIKDDSKRIAAAGRRKNRGGHRQVQ
jgi:hypothetical protein